jgi:hypothetical protein
MIKIRLGDGPLRIAAMVGIETASDGLARAERMGVPTTAAGVDGLVQMPRFGDNAEMLHPERRRLGIDACFARRPDPVAEQGHGGGNQVGAHHTYADKSVKSRPNDLPPRSALVD